jgi:hypothetical protein
MSAHAIAPRGGLARAAGWRNPRPRPRPQPCAVPAPPAVPARPSDNGQVALAEFDRHTAARRANQGSPDCAILPAC